MFERVVQKVFTIASFPDVSVSPTKNRVRTSLRLEYQSPVVSNIVGSTGEMRNTTIYRYLQKPLRVYNDSKQKSRQGR